MSSTKGKFGGVSNYAKTNMNLQKSMFNAGGLNTNTISFKP